MRTATRWDDRALPSRPPVLGRYIIFSPSEDAERPGEGYWSERFGWAEREYATEYADSTDQPRVDAPAPADVTWVRV